MIVTVISIPCSIDFFFNLVITFFTTAVFPVPGFPKTKRLEGLPFFNTTDSTCAIVLDSSSLNGNFSGT